MSWLSNLFKDSPKIEAKPILTDMHSHILFGLDDGSKSLEESVALVKRAAELGYKKLICTPHIMGDFYKNSFETIQPKLLLLEEALTEENIEVKIEFAAEYYLDEFFIEKLDNNEKLLTFGDNFLLVETSYMNKPHNFEDAVFKIQSKGYKLVLAHPERYVYLFDDYEFLKKIYHKNVLLQVNLLSLAGYYSGQSKKIAEKLIDDEMVSFIGTDCHGMKHLDVLAKVKELNSYKKVTNQPLYNNFL